MSNIPLELEVQSDSGHNPEKINAFLSGVPVIYIEKYPDFASVNWKVDSNGTMGEYFLELADFYIQLKKGGFAKVNRGPHSTGILLFSKAGREHFSLRYLVGGLPALLRQTHFGDFYYMRLDVPYAAFGMTSGTSRDVTPGCSRDPWNPETGQLWAMASQDISVPLSKLIKTTLAGNVGQDQLQSILSTRAYK